MRNRHHGGDSKNNKDICRDNSQECRWLLSSHCKSYFPKILAPKMTTIKKRTRKIKNNTLAMEAAPAAIPVKPKIAAIIAIIKKIAAHLSIKKDFIDYTHINPCHNQIVLVRMISFAYLFSALLL